MIKSHGIYSIHTFQQCSWLKGQVSFWILLTPISFWSGKQVKFILQCPALIFTIIGWSCEQMYWRCWSWRLEVVLWCLLSVLPRVCMTLFQQIYLHSALLILHSGPKTHRGCLISDSSGFISTCLLGQYSQEVAAVDSWLHFSI